MDVFLGLLIISIGSFGQSSSYVPIKKIKSWEWENFWLVQGFFAWIIFPIVETFLAVSDLSDLIQILSVGGATKSILYGLFWGIGGLTFGLSMRYLGVSLGQSLSLGTCSAFGTLIPFMMSESDILDRNGIILLIGVAITLIGIFVIGYSGHLRQSSDNRNKDFNLLKGIIVALLAGVMSACFALGLNSGQSIKEAAISNGINPLLAGLPVVMLVTLGGFITNFIYCIYQNVKNQTGRKYLNIDSKLLTENILFSSLAGLLWYSQFFGLEVGRSFLVENKMLTAFSWSILMSLNVIFSNVWGIMLHEWDGVNVRTKVVLITGLLILVFSIFFPSIV